MSLRDRLICFVCWNDSACTPFPATTTQLFFQRLSSHTLCSCLEVLLTTNNLCNLWHNKFQRQHLRVLQLGRYIYAKMEFQISQKLVQVQQIPIHVVGQHIYRKDSLFVLKQPSGNVFLIRNECWRLF